MTENTLETQTKERFLKNRPNVICLVLFCLLNALTWAYIFLKIKPQADPIYLHYNIYFGVDLIGEWYRIFILPAVGILIGVVHFFIARVVHRKNIIISYIILWLAIGLQLILLLSTHLIIRQN